jgi:glucose-1-phosphate thymidylyltransferase
MDTKKLCLERDYFRCRHCGASDGLNARQIVKKENEISWHLSNLITLCEECNFKADQNKENAVKNRVGVLLCGGKGSRLSPLTKYQNKHTLPISLIPMILYPIKTLQKFKVSRVIVVLDRENSNTIMEMLGSGREFGMEISYRVQEGSGGIADALYLAKEFIKQDDDIVCILGDNIFDNEGLDIDYNLTNNKSCVYIKEVSNPQDYGVAKVENDKVMEIVEKPKKYISNLAVLGLYIYTYEVFKIIENVKPSKRGELEISSVNNTYAINNELQYKIIKGYWADAGSSIQKYCEASLYGAKQANVSANEIEAFRSVVFDDK